MMADNNMEEEADYHSDTEVDDEEFEQAFGEHTGISDHCQENTRRIKNNQPTGYNYVDPKLLLDGYDAELFTNQAWELLGKYIAGNTHLIELDLEACGLTDEKMALLFSELVGSTSLKTFNCADNSFGIEGVRSMIPFLRNSENLSTLILSRNNNINNECFDILVSALSGTSVKKLFFCNCNITDISALVRHNLPNPNLQALSLSQNNIGREGCIAISNLLQKEGSTLKTLYLRDTGIGDQEAELLATALKHNTSLKELHLSNNNGITERGHVAFLKLLVDASSIESTYNSNDTLTAVRTNSEMSLVDKACLMNKNNADSHAAGRAKVIENQLNSQNRKKICELQGIEYSAGSIFADIEPVLLPKILALIGDRHGQSELYTALIPTAPDLLSYIDKKAMLNDTLAKNAAHANALNEEKAAFLAKYEREMACLTAHNADIHRRLELVELGDTKQETKQDERDKGVRSNKRQRS